LEMGLWKMMTEYALVMTQQKRRIRLQFIKCFKKYPKLSDCYDFGHYKFYL